ncbi:hypothetical protein RvY_18684 [Ramazzottius varieornatus]|uniref:Uncharacterized protein n=1 Tax=Ramazzottius varieornatus TaxID=947166 RepID=A0A1D1W6Y3_RAMVA|nr:hypothetical protein RvY_18684 [Ramazzottius varieornatus]
MNISCLAEELPIGRCPWGFRSFEIFSFLSAFWFCLSTWLHRTGPSANTVGKHRSFFKVARHGGDFGWNHAPLGKTIWLRLLAGKRLIFLVFVSLISSLVCKLCALLLSSDFMTRRQN